MLKLEDFLEIKINKNEIDLMLIKGGAGTKTAGGTMNCPDGCSFTNNCGDVNTIPAGGSFHYTCDTSYECGHVDYFCTNCTKWYV